MKFINYFFGGLLIFGTIFVITSHKRGVVWGVFFLFIVCLHNLLYSLLNKEARVKWVTVKKSDQPELYELVTFLWFVASIVAGFLLYKELVIP